jgi:hypothetical protein
MPASDAAECAPIRRLLALTRTDTGQARRAANVLLARRIAYNCGGFGLTDFGNVNHTITHDMLATARFIASQHNDPDVCGLRTAFEYLAAPWRPARGEQPRAPGKHPEPRSRPGGRTIGFQSAMTRQCEARGGAARPAKSGYRPIGRPPAAAERASISSTSRHASSRLRGWRGPWSNGAHAPYPASVRSVAVSNDHRSTARSAASSLATRALSASMVSDIQSSRVGNGSLAGRPSRPAPAPRQPECCRLRRVDRPLATATGQMNAVRTRTGPGAASPAPLRQSGVGLRR